MRLDPTRASIAAARGRAVQDGRLPLCIANRPANLQNRSFERAFGRVRLPSFSNIHCEELLHRRRLQDMGFNEGHRAGLLDHDIMLLSPGIVQI